MPTPKDSEDEREIAEEARVIAEEKPEPAGKCYAKRRRANERLPSMNAS
jgi:hypothetical protein